MESDFRYYSRRAQEEQRRANFAVTDEARERHRELATLFAAKAAERVHVNVNVISCLKTEDLTA